MNRKAARVPALLLLLLAVAGCTNWPPHGRGGMAELHAPALVNPAPVDGLPDRLGCEVARVDSLQQQVAQRGILSGRMTLLQGAAARVQREYYAGLYGDAARSLQALRDKTTAEGPELPPGIRLPPECT